MLLTEVSNHIECKVYFIENITNLKIQHIYTNSINVKKNSIFAIKNNKTAKKIYIEEAIQKGALAILTNKHFKKIKITQFVVKNINESVKIILNTLYPNPPINSIAVTGTNGKTSVVWYILQISNLSSVDTKTSGTLGYYINNSKKKNTNLTTPEFEILHQTAFTKKRNKYNYIFEASSHSIDQNRIKDFPINIAALTNITQDHLDYHKNLENYREVKLKLFKNFLDKNGYAILNDTISGIDKIKRKINNKIITYGSRKSDIYLFKDKKKTKLIFFDKLYSLNINNYSYIELENLSCAIACCYCLKFDIKKIIKIFNKIKSPPGRLQMIESISKNFKVFVDYAHTPDALKKVLISQTINNKKPHIVFGCGGNRDKNKRQTMGKVANKYADKVYITDDNPRDEDPIKIRKQIIKNCKKAVEISSRKNAISEAIINLKKNDILIVAGKGHEKNQVYKDHVKSFDDVKVINNELKKIK